MPVTTDLLGIYGASGFGKEVMAFAAPIIGPHQDVMFIDDSAPSASGRFKTVSFDEFCAMPGTKSVAIAIADSRTRAMLADRCMAASLASTPVHASSAFIGYDVIIGEGSILCNFVTLTASATIGRYFHANIYSYVAHDCVIGDYVTFAPGVKCNGNVVIEDHAYIGTGAILKQGQPGNPLIIGKGAIIGMGAVVTKSVAAGQTVVGNPARPIVRV